MIKILDNVIPKETQDLIENSLIEANWVFSRSIAYKYNKEVSEEQKNKIMGFTHMILKDSNVLDDNINLYCEPLVAAVKQIGGDVKGLFNMRAQLQLPTPADGYGSVHIDSHIAGDYKVCLYYANDVDGDTILFKQTKNNCTPEEVKSGLLEEHMRISPKKGRFVIFDGDIYHCGSKPTKEARFVINYNVYLNG